jgi:hypothetical protein
MRRKKTISGRKNEQGIIIALVAVFMLFVIGAMAALSIDVVTMYTARSEAQLAADAAALAGARVLANSGMTSDATLTAGAETLAGTVAVQVGQQNQVGGRNLIAANGEVVVVGFLGTVTNPCTAPTNPCITVHVQRTDLPTFFARILGRTQVTVGASATAEAYNPSATGAPGGGPAVAPICVKPWLLPNMDPTQPMPPFTQPAAIFTATGAIVKPGLVGQGWPNPTGNPNGLFARCGDCTGSLIPPPLTGEYYPVAIDAPAPDFPHPTQALPNCSTGFTAYQFAVAGCVQQPISCGVNSAINPTAINIDTNTYTSSTGSRDSDTVQAAECLIHYNAPGDSDSIDPTVVPNPPFQFSAGAENPIVLSGAMAAGADVMVSDSLVTIPVIDILNSDRGVNPSNPVTVMGFLQVFLNPQSTTTLPVGPPGTYQLPVTIINMAGCGTSVTGPPILGNGASPVAVRLISPP